MHLSTLSTTAATNTSQLHVDDYWLSDESLSQHSYDSPRPERRHRTYDYLSTNLVTGSYLTLADVVAESVLKETIHERQHMAAARCRFK